MHYIDVLTQIIRILPPPRRLQKNIALLYSYLRPLDILHNAQSLTPKWKYPNCGNGVVSFLAYRLYIFLTVSWNGQTIVLERLLNLWYFGYFNPSEAVGNVGYYIYIQDKTGGVDVKAIYQQSEGITLPLYQKSEYTASPAPPPNANNGNAGPQYLYQEEEFYNSDRFIVNVPSWFSFTQSEMEGLIDKYKVAGVQYEIKYY